MLLDTFIRSVVHVGMVRVQRYMSSCGWNLVTPVEPYTNLIFKHLF